MVKQCPKCGYVRQPEDMVPDYECPKCGIVYQKFKRIPENQTPIDSFNQNTSDIKSPKLKMIVIVVIVLLISIFIVQRLLVKSKNPLTINEQTIPDGANFKYDIRGTYRGVGYNSEKMNNQNVEFSIGDDYRIKNIEWTRYKTPYRERVVSWAYPSDVSMRSTALDRECSVSIKNQSLVVALYGARSLFDNFELQYDYTEDPYIKNDRRTTGVFSLDNNTNNLSCTIIAMIPDIVKSDPIPKENVNIEHSGSYLHANDKFRVRLLKDFVIYYNNSEGHRKFIDPKIYKTFTMLDGRDMGVILGLTKIKGKEIGFELHGGDFIGIIPMTLCPCNSFLLDMNLINAKREIGGKLEIEEGESTFYTISYRGVNPAMQSRIKIVFCENGEKYALNLNCKINKQIDPVTKRETSKFLRYELEKVE